MMCYRHAAYPEPLRGGHFPCEIVTDHPRLFRLHTELFQRVPIDPFVRFAVAKFALNQNATEVWLQQMPLHCGD